MVSIVSSSSCIQDLTAALEALADINKTAYAPGAPGNTSIASSSGSLVSSSVDSADDPEAKRQEVFYRKRISWDDEDIKKLLKPKTKKGFLFTSIED